MKENDNEKEEVKISLFSFYLTKILSYRWQSEFKDLKKPNLAQPLTLLGQWKGKGEETKIVKKKMFKFNCFFQPNENFTL